MRWRVRLGYPLAAVFLWLAQPTPRSLMAGTLIAILGLAVRAAAAGTLRKQEELSTSGVYAYTRNPLYLGSALLASGMVVASRSWIAAALVGVYFPVFYTAVMKREEGELAARFGEAFHTYAREVPLFFPRVAVGPGAAKSGSGFTWHQYMSNREWRAALGTVLVVAFLWLKMVWR
jgi:protein-S-isoprenylcysteine O-methyltransferase Ste14